MKGLEEQFNEMVEKRASELALEKFGVATDKIYEAAEEFRLKLGLTKSSEDDD